MRRPHDAHTLRAMDTSWSSSRATGAAVLVAALLATGCGDSGSAQSTPSVSHGTTSTSQSPCGGERPILFLAGTSCADGTASSATPMKGAGDSWSPGGDQVAFVSANAKRLIVRGPDGSQRTVFHAPSKVDIVHRPAWSPDGARLAVLLLDEHGFGGGLAIGTGQLPSFRASLAVFDAHSGVLRRRVALSPAVVHMPYLMNPPDTLAFSPGGDRVLVSWESPAVVDLRTGRVQHVWRTPSVAGWTSDGRVLFLDVVNRQRFGALRVWSSSGGQHVAWTAARLRSNGIVAEHGIEYGELRTSPDGSSLAIRTSRPDGTAVVVYGLSGSTPTQHIGTYPTDGRIWDFDWSPKSDQIAAVVVAGSTAEVRVLNLDKHTWASVATVPIGIDSADTIEALAPIKKLSWNS